MTRIKTKTASCGYHLISINVVSLFKNFPLDATIDIVLKRIYNDREINTETKKKKKID